MAMASTGFPNINTMSPLFVVANLEQSLSYYTIQLGFNISFRYEDFYAGIVKDGCSIHLKCGIPDKEIRAHKKTNEHIDITFTITNISDFFEALKSKHIDIIQPLRQMPYGREFYIADPDGYLLSFLEV
jgi:uncharacterized glyoxalase superfamily protein PhnB